MGLGKYQPSGTFSLMLYVPGCTWKIWVSFVPVPSSLKVKLVPPGIFELNSKA
jgi:hypothetical protein